MKLNKFSVFILLPLLLSGCGKKEVEPTSIDIKESEIVIAINESKSLHTIITPDNATNKTVSWASKNIGIAKVDQTGKVTGLKVGEAEVVATVGKNKLTDTCIIKVLDASKVSGIILDNEYLKMEIGDTKTLVATVLPETAENKNVTWASSDTSVASVVNGKVTALSEGNTNITAVTQDGGFIATCSVAVKAAQGMWDSSQDSLRTGAKTLDLYSLNDFHGATAYSQEAGEPGLNKIAKYLKNEKAKNPKGFMVTSSGDMWQGSADSNLTKGRLVTDWMNMLDFKAMCVGNHEFDWTIDTIKSNSQRMNFDLLACNIITTSTGEVVDWVKPYTTATINGVHVGIVGAIGENLTADILASNVKGLTFADPNPYIRSWASYLRDNGADVVLTLIHDSVFNVSEETGNAVDAIFGGHTHTNQNTYIGSSPAIQASCNGKSIGHITLTYDFSSSKVTSSDKLYVQASKYIGLEDDSESSVLYQKYLDEEISAIKDRVVSDYDEGIGKYDIPNIFNNYSYKFFKEEIDLDNEYVIKAVGTNNARADIPTGPITYGDVYKALPFDNYLCLIKVQGKYISYICNYGTWFIPGKGYAEVDTISSGCKSTDYYYLLTIDYIAYYEGKTKYVNEFVDTYGQEEALPRNIFAKYLNNYPNNVI